MAILKDPKDPKGLMAALGPSALGMSSSEENLIGSTAYLKQLVKEDRQSEFFMQNQKSFGSLYSTSHSGSATKLNFDKASTAGGEYLAFNAKPGTCAGFLVDANANK